VHIYVTGIVVKIEVLNMTMSVAFVIGGLVL